MSHSNRGGVPVIVLLAALVFLGAVIFLLLDDSGEPPVEPDDPAIEEALKPPKEKLEGAELRGPVPTPETGRTETTRTTVDIPEVLAQVVFGRIVNNDGLPIEGARVKLVEQVTPTRAHLRYSDNPGLISFVDITDHTGRYEFDQLPVGAVFDVWVTHALYAPTLGVPVMAVTEAQEMRDVVLKDGYRIWGRVTDGAGNPLVARVEAKLQENRYRPGTDEDKRDGDIQDGRIRILDSDVNGNFDMLNCAEGIWTLEVKAEGYATETVTPVVLMGEQRESEQVVQLGTEYVLEGYVVNAEEEAVPHAKIYVARTNPRPVITANVQADGQGRFLLRGLASGVYGMHCQAETYSGTRMPRVQAGKRDLKIVMHRRGGVAGRALDELGRPLRKFSLEVRRINRNTKVYGFIGKKLEFNDTDGNFLIADLDPGSYILLAKAPGMAPTWSPGFKVERKIVEPVDINIKRGGTLVGYVNSAATGSPLPGASIVIRGEEYEPDSMTSIFGESPLDPNNVPRMTTKVGSDGRFELRNAYPGPVKVEIKHPTHLSEFVSITVAEGAQTDLGSVTLQTGGTITGTAFDAKGDPLAGGTAYLTRKNDNGPFFGTSRTLDTRGRFRFDALQAGTYIVSASSFEAEGFLFLTEGEESEQTVVLANGETKEVILQLAN